MLILNSILLGLLFKLPLIFVIGILTVRYYLSGFAIDYLNDFCALFYFLLSLLLPDIVLPNQAI